MKIQQTWRTLSILILHIPLIWSHFCFWTKTTQKPYRCIIGAINWRFEEVTGWDIIVFDAYYRGKFTLRAMLLWAINDIPTYGILFGHVVKGYHDCPVCSENMQTINQLLWEQVHSYVLSNVFKVCGFILHAAI